MTEDQGLPCQEPPNRWRDFKRRVARKTWWWTSPVAWWIYRKMPKWIGEPEAYERLPRFLARWLSGFKEACWSHACGHDIRYSLHIGNIYWGIGKKVEEEKPRPGR